MADKAQTISLARIWCSRILLAANIALFIVLIGFWASRSVVLSAPWDGPAIATVALTAAAITLAAVGIGVGLLAVWGYTTLREHAGKVAEAAARVAADRAADRKVQELLREWGLPAEGDSPEAVAKAYERE